MRERTAAYPVSLPDPLYCDTSALLKLYLPEPGSDDFNRVIEGRDDLLVSDLAVTEIVAAVTRRVRGAGLSPRIARRVRDAIVASLDDERYRRVELTQEVHRRAEEFLLEFTGSPLRVADALHLALAMSAGTRSMASFDARLSAAARAMGLAVYPA